MISWILLYKRFSVQLAPRVIGSAKSIPIIFVRRENFPFTEIYNLYFSLKRQRGNSLYYCYTFLRHDFVTSFLWWHPNDFRVPPLFPKLNIGKNMKTTYPEKTSSNKSKYNRYQTRQINIYPPTPIPLLVT